MSIVVEAALADVQAAIEADPALRELKDTLALRQSTLPPPRRSLEELPSIITIVDFLGTSLATNIAYDVGKKLLFDALAHHFGKHKVKEEPKERFEAPDPEKPGDS